jgi:hypothetical protein
MDKILKSILKRQIPFMICGTITGTIMTYYYGFLFAIVVNSAIWWVISYIVSKYYWKSTGLKDQSIFFNMRYQKLIRRKQIINFLDIANILLRYKILRNSKN